MLLAFEGKIDFVTKTNPFGSKPAPKPTDKQSVEAQRAIFLRMKMDAWEEARRNKEASVNE